LYGIDFTSVLGSDVNIGYKVLGVVKSGWDIGSIIGAVILSLFVSLLSSYYPAKKAAALQPAECLRTVQ
jgi:ABC-type lipoprotein release transport system permease subunit